MSSYPDVFVKTSQEGIDRVKAESYAFLMESTSIEYTIQHECKLTKIGGLLDNKGYGIGLPEGLIITFNLKNEFFLLNIGSPYRERFSEIILNLQEKGTVSRIN
jgi:ionotropic glutamate receptor